MDIKQLSVSQWMLLRIEAAPAPEESKKEETEPVTDQAATRMGGMGRWRVEEMEALKEGWSDEGSEQNAIEGEGIFLLDVLIS